MNKLRLALEVLLKTQNLQARGDKHGDTSIVQLMCVVARTKAWQIYYTF
jgi:hypothetical protein